MHDRGLNGDLRRMLLVVVVYFAAASVFVWFFRDNPAALLGSILQDLPHSFALFMQIGWWVPLTLLPVMILAPWRKILYRIPATMVMILLCTAFFLIFTMIKNSMTFAIPFWADPILAKIDQGLHGGTDPIILAHSFAMPVPTGLLEPIYSSSWLAPAMYLPALSALFDSSAARRRRFTILYVLAWVVLGNALALAFMSAGPIYYDRVLGAPRFDYIAQLLRLAGLEGTNLTGLQDWLWRAYQSRGHVAGAGISAFPSVHVAMATVLALYLFELDRRLWPLSLLFVALYQFLSVYLAWHYAIDGYFSILVILPAWAFLRARAPNHQATG